MYECEVGKLALLIGVSSVWIESIPRDREDPSHSRTAETTRTHGNRQQIENCHPNSRWKYQKNVTSLKGTRKYTNIVHISNAFFTDTQEFSAVHV